MLYYDVRWGRRKSRRTRSVYAKRLNITFGAGEVIFTHKHV